MPDTGSRIRVALVDDQPLFRSGIRMLIESQQDMEMAGEANDGVEAVALAAETRADVMLMDLRNTGALMFRNSATGEYNMIYRREDGNIGWVEPGRS